MQDMKQQLEDLAFATLHPKRYAEIDHMVSTRTPERELYLTQVLEQVRERLAELHIVAEVTGRPKHLWSIYEKMVVKGKEFDDIFDLVGIRVLRPQLRAGQRFRDMHCLLVGMVLAAPMRIIRGSDTGCQKRE